MATQQQQKQYLLVVEQWWQLNRNEEICQREVSD